MKANCIKLQTIDPEICSILTFQKRVWDQFLHYILHMIFPEKCFPCFILLTDQIPSSDCLYILRYWAICVLQLFVNQAVTPLNLKLALSFSSSPCDKCSKLQHKNLDILRTKKGKIEAFSVIFKRLSVAEICLRPQSTSLC